MDRGICVVFVGWGYKEYVEHEKVVSKLVRSKNLRFFFGVNRKKTFALKAHQTSYDCFYVMGDARHVPSALGAYGSSGHQIAAASPYQINSRHAKCSKPSQC